jgi:hypothetical protein
MKSGDRERKETSINAINQTIIKNKIGLVEDG